MTDRPNVVEQLLPRVRAGEEAARAELFEHLKPSLRRAADRQRQRHPGGKSTETLLAETIHEAERRFAEFQGTSQAAVRAWLMDILAQIAHSPAGAEEDPNATISPGSAAATTLAKAVSDSAVVSPPAAAADDPHGTLPADSPAARELAKAVSDSAAMPPTPTETPPSQPDAADTLAVAGRDADATIAPDANATMAGATPKPAAPPAKTFGDYDILKTIAKGGMGVVYKARQRKLNRIVALKMILAGQFADQADVDRFYTEAQAAGKLDHKNIVGIHEVGECDGQHFFSMQYVEGQGLDSMVRERPLAPRVAARYMRKIAAAMQHAHELGVLHRDLKPANILVDQRDEPLITDFGLAKRADDQSQVTMAGTIMGTASYMPPEQATGNLDAISAKSDVYSLGATLYELLTGRPPFGAASVWETIKQVKESEPVSPRVLNPSVPADLETICLKCLQKEPARRYATAQELVEELERYLKGEPILARPVGPVERGWRWCKRNPRVASLAVLAALGFVMAFAGISTGYVRTRAALADARTSIDQMRIAIDELYTDVSNEDLLNEPALKTFRQNLLRKARDLYGKALDRLGRDDCEIQEDLAGSHFLLGRILLELEAPSEALGPLETAAEIQRKLLADQPSNVLRIHALANTLNFKGEVLENMGQLDAALAVYDETVALRQRLVDLDASAERVEYQRKLINSQMNSGLIHRKMMQNASDQAALQKHYREALDWLNRAQSGRKAAHEQARDDPKLHLDLAKGAFNLALVRWEWLCETQLTDALAAEIDSNLNEAESYLADLLAEGAGERFKEFERLELAEVKYLSALVLQQAGQLQNEREDSPGAEAKYEEALAILDQLVAEDQATHQYRETLAATYNLIGRASYADMRDEHAIASHEKAMENYESLVRDFHSIPAYRADLGRTCHRLGDIVPDFESAEKYYARAISTFQQLVTDYPNAAEYKELREDATAARQVLKEEMQAEPPQQPDPPSESESYPLPPPEASQDEASPEQDLSTQTSAAP